MTLPALNPSQDTEIARLYLEGYSTHCIADEYKITPRLIVRALARQNVPLPTECRVEGCAKKPRDRDWCHMHYSRWRTHKDLDKTTKRHDNITNEDGLRECFGCWESKPLDEFSIRKGKAVYESRCKDCNRQTAKRWKENNPEKVTRSRRAKNLRKYSISEAEYSKMLVAQEGRCFICRGTEPGAGRNYFHIDHDHGCCPGDSSCGKCVRDLLCGKCNTGIGHFNDDPMLLRVAADYLEVYMKGRADE